MCETHETAKNKRYCSLYTNNMSTDRSQSDTQAVCCHCCSDCPSCPVNGIQMGQVTWAI